MAMTRKLLLSLNTQFKNHRKNVDWFIFQKKTHSHSEPEGWAKSTEGSPPELRTLTLKTKTPIVKGLYSTQLFPFIVPVTFRMSNLSYLIVLLEKIQKLPEYEVNLDYYTNDIDYNEDTVHNGKQGYENIYAV